MKNNADYKNSSNLNYILRTFNVGHHAIVRFKPKQFPSRREETRANDFFLNPLEDQFKCLCGGSSTEF